jgi:hypothetical protein
MSSAFLKYDYGQANYNHKQYIVFEMAPEIVSVEKEVEIIIGMTVKRKRTKVTAGKLGIDLERSLVIHEERDPNFSCRRWGPHSRVCVSLTLFSAPHRHQKINFPRPCLFETFPDQSSHNFRQF